MKFSFAGGKALGEHAHPGLFLGGCAMGGVEGWKGKGNARRVEPAGVC